MLQEYSNNLYCMYLISSWKHWVFMQGHYRKNPSRIRHFLRRLPHASQHPSEVPLVQSVTRKWSVFSSWCNHRQINPFTVNVQQLAAFLFEQQMGGGGACFYYISTLKCKSKLDISNSIISYCFDEEF